MSPHSSLSPTTSSWPTATPVPTSAAAPLPGSTRFTSCKPVRPVSRGVDDAPKELGGQFVGPTVAGSSEARVRDAREG